MWTQVAAGIQGSCGEGEDDGERRGEEGSRRRVHSYYDRRALPASAIEQRMCVLALSSALNQGGHCALLTG
jgi:hypothetical protein